MTERPTLDVSSPEKLQRLMHAEFPVSPQQWDAVSAPLAPAVIMAGAGSGKTTLMAARVVYLVASGQVAPEQVLGLTFTTKAASELLHRVRSGLDAAGLLDTADTELGEPTVSTYHSYAAALLTDHGLRIGHEPDTRVMADASRYQLASRVIAAHTEEVRGLSDHPATVIGYVLALDAALSEHLVTPSQLRDFDDRERARFEADLTTALRNDVDGAFLRRAEALRLVEEYRAAKTRHGLMDFSDQIAAAATLAERHPGVGEAERERFAVVLLDEYQDTSVGQARMLTSLFGAGHPVMAVGDPNQAIYGWRGASVSNIIGFDRDFPRSDGRPVATYSLTVNRRSDARILEVANAIAEPLYDQLEHVARLEPGTDAMGEVDVIVHETVTDERDWLAEEILRLREQEGGLAWSDIGVLVRDNTSAAETFATLTAADIPVEIVGLSGLLHLPEINEVICTLALLDDLTANAELLTLLAGPRWAIGHRDLALLGQRAKQLAKDSRGGRRATADDRPLADALDDAVAGADPVEVVALIDALGDPGELAYSTEARARFAALDDELRALRRHVDEPLTDLVRRIVDTTGIDLELASASTHAASARRDNLELFTQAVAEFQAVDGQVTLASLLAWLEAEDEFGEGLDVATPSEADSVKLLTVHRAKGLEWDVVFCLGVCDTKFPHATSRGIWPTRVEILPTPLRGDARDLPVLHGHTKEDVKLLKDDTKAHQLVEERRLGYVAFTRARHRLYVSSYLWRPARQSPLGPSEYQTTIRDAIATWGGTPLAWHDKPEKGAVNPLNQEAESYPWPHHPETEELRRRAAAAELVRDALARGNAPADESLLDLADLTDEQQDLMAGWDEDLELLLEEAAAIRDATHEVPLPSHLSVSAVQAFAADADAFTASLVRPMPRKPSRAARAGTAFHTWVEQRFGQRGLLDPDEVWGRAEEEQALVTAGESEADLRELIEAFEAGRFADRTPHACEQSFSLVLADQVIRGAIDAVFVDERDGDDGWLLVDWKTNRRTTADPLQLALYRIAWADLQGVPVEQVRAAFYYVRSDELVEPDLPDRPEIEALLS